MECIHDAALLSRYLENDLSIEEMNAISTHLEKCEFCKKEFERLKTAMVIMKSVQEVPAPRNYAEVIQERLKHC